MQADKLDDEAQAFWRVVARSLDGLMEIVTGVDGAGLDWTPPIAGANSLHVLATHTLANAEENIVEILGGEPVRRQREREFDGAAGVTSDIAARWRALRLKLEATMARLDRAALDRIYTHARRGTLTGREVLLLVIRHAAEHLGHAELTRDLYQASKATS